MRARLSDLSLSAVAAGFVAVLVGFTSSVAIVFQAATALATATASGGLTLWGIGSAFWGVVAGALALFVQQWRPVKTAA